MLSSSDVHNSSLLLPVQYGISHTLVTLEEKVQYGRALSGSSDIIWDLLPLVVASSPLYNLSESSLSTTEDKYKKQARKTQLLNSYCAVPLISWLALKDASSLLQRMLIYKSP